MTDPYVHSLEKEIEANEKILDRIGELVDEGVFATSAKEARSIFVSIGKLIGLNMSDVIEEDDGDIFDSLSSEWEDLYND